MLYKIYFTTLQYFFSLYHCLLCLFAYLFFSWSCFLFYLYYYYCYFLYKYSVLLLSFFLIYSTSTAFNIIFHFVNKLIYTLFSFSYDYDSYFVCFFSSSFICYLYVFSILSFPSSFILFDYFYFIHHHNNFFFMVFFYVVVFVLI